MSRSAAKDSFAATRLCQGSIKVHGRWPWLGSIAATRLNTEAAVAAAFFNNGHVSKTKFRYGSTAHRKSAGTSVVELYSPMMAGPLIT